MMESFKYLNTQYCVYEGENQSVNRKDALRQVPQILPRKWDENVVKDRAVNQERDEKMKEVKPQLCACGCGQMTSGKWFYGGYVRFIPGHQNRGKKWSEDIIEKRVIGRKKWNEKNPDKVKEIQRNQNEILKTRRKKELEQLNIPIKISDIPQESHQVLLGSILGDGGCFKHTNRESYHYEEPHSPKQREYLIWKRQFFEKIATVNIYKKEHAYSLLASNLFLFNTFRNLFYKNGKKIVIEKTLNALNTLGLAVWYLDDGYYAVRGRSIEISTRAFSFDEQKIIQKYFKEKFGINCRIYKKFDKRRSKSYYIIYFLVKEADKFLRLIKPVFIKYKIPKEMWYKLGHLWEGNKEKIEMAQQKVLECSKKWYQKNKDRHNETSRIWKLNHPQKTRTYTERYHNKCMARGLCINCGKPNNTPHIHCQGCLKKARDRYYKKKKERLL